MSRSERTLSGRGGARNVLLADDEPAILALLRRRLAAETDLFVCGEATDAADTVRLVALLRPDVLVLDWHLPGIHGPQLIGAVATACPSTQIVVYTSDPSAARAATISGAGRFIIKGADLSELITAIRH